MKNCKRRVLRTFFTGVVLGAPRWDEIGKRWGKDDQPGSCLRAADDGALLQLAHDLRRRACCGEARDSLLPDVFGAACAADHRILWLRPMAAGGVLHYGTIASWLPESGRSAGANGGVMKS